MKERARIILWHNRAADNPNSTRYAGFVNRLRKYSPGLKKLEIVSASLADVVVEIVGKKARIFNPQTGEDFSDASLYIFRSWHQQAEMAAAVISLAEARGIEVLDHQLSGISPGKFKHHVLFWAAGLPQPITVLCASSISAQRYIMSKKNALGWPCIVKASDGQKGENNYLVKSKDTLEDTLVKLDGKQIILQEFIENQGDWRVLCFGEKVRMGFFRQAASALSHHNNASTGGRTQLFQTKDIAQEVISLAQSAAKVTNVQIAGVDIIPNSSGKLYLLEVNHPPQIATGVYVDSKLRHFGDFLQENLSHRYPNKKNAGSAKSTIGRHVLVELPEFNITKIPAKVDTGAYTTALHARKVEAKGNKLYFECKNKAGTWTRHSTENFTNTRILNTHGRSSRFVIVTELIIRGRLIKTPVTLVDRSDMRYELLLGRKLLRGNFIVDVELSQKGQL